MPETAGAARRQPRTPRAARTAAACASMMTNIARAWICGLSPASSLVGRNWRGVVTADDAEGILKASCWFLLVGFLDTLETAMVATDLLEQEAAETASEAASPEFSNRRRVERGAWVSRRRYDEIRRADVCGEGWAAHEQHRQSGSVVGMCVDCAMSGSC